MREDGAGDQQREVREELEEGKEQEMQQCNNQRRKTREGGLTLKDKWTQGLKKTPIAGVAFSAGKHTLSQGN